MAELWTFSGVNSWREAAQDYLDYTGENLTSRGVAQNPSRQYVSRLGTGPHYRNLGTSILGLRPERLLDEEAQSFADGTMGSYGAVRRTHFRNRRVHCLLLAPKTTTRPPAGSRLLVEIYWSPNDDVPSQSLLRPDSLNYWRKYRRGGGAVWPVENRQGHAVAGFLTPRPRIVTRRLHRVPGRGARKQVWLRTGDFAPSAIDTVNAWLADASVDFVLVGHSQGANIAMWLLERGLSAGS